MSWEDEDPEGFRAPLPPDDRLWRHPSEVAAAQRSANQPGAPLTTTATFRTPWRQGLGLALLGAATGALVVTGMFLSMRTSPAPGRPVTQAFAVDPVVPIPIHVEKSDWAATVSEQAFAGVATLNVSRGTKVAVGSGVAYRSNGLLLTSARLVEGADLITVITSDAEHHVGDLLGIDQVSGLAVVRIDVEDQPIVQLGILDQPAIGDYAVAVGGSSTAADISMLTLTALEAQVASENADSLYGMLEGSGPPPVGADGGALVGDQGAVVGIVLDVGGPHTTYAVPIGFARKVAADIAESGTGRHPWIGVKGKTLPVDEQIELGLVGGVKLTQVIGAPAEDADLRRGDIITKLDDEPVNSFTDLILILRRHIPGKVLAIEFERDSETHRTDIELQLRGTGEST